MEQPLAQPFDNSTQNQIPVEKPIYTKAQKWLLLAALLLGVVFDILIRREIHCVMPIFWICYLVVHYALRGKKILKNKSATLLAVAAVVLCALDIVRSAHLGMEPGDAKDALLTLRLIDFAAVPALLMLHMVVTTYDIPLQREGAVIPAWFAGFFVKPFTAIGKCFGALAATLQTKKQGMTRRILLGLAVGLPLMVLVLWLLVRADSVMAGMFTSLFRNLRLGTLFSHAIVILIVAILFYSFLYNAAWEKKPALQERRAPAWEPASMLTVLILLLCVYAVFGYVQFRYLFGGRLPAEYTYSEYARRGFSEICVVAVINFALLGLCIRYGKNSGALTVAKYLLLVATAVLLASAILRLSLYIGAYGLTIFRILPMWFLIFLSALTLLCAVRLAREKLPVLRIAGLAFAVWYVVLCAMPWTRIIEQWNRTL